jgi:ubiquinone/menaquinone biosynthesis C-methylase UbiE
MGYLAFRHLRAAGIMAPGLVRGASQALPFAESSFDTLVSTFPSEYIFDARTLSEVRRVLDPQGRLVVLPAAWPGNRLLAWLFKVTGESPSEALEAVKARMQIPFQKAGFFVEIQILQADSGTLILLIAAPEKD